MNELMIPPHQPNITRETAEGILRECRIALPLVKVAVIGIRGYYKDTMGRPGLNDRGVYDDAAAVITHNAFQTFNFNTDPSKYVKGVATLKPGIIWYKQGKHGISWKSGSYPAFRPATPDEQVPVVRDGTTLVNLKGTALNIHRGGVGTTASEGCQTVPPSQWDNFRHLIYSEMNREGVTKFPYLLLTEVEYQALIA